MDAHANGDGVDGWANWGMKLKAAKQRQGQGVMQSANWLTSCSICLPEREMGSFLRSSCDIVTFKRQNSASSFPVHNAGPPAFTTLASRHFALAARAVRRSPSCPVAAVMLLLSQLACPALACCFGDASARSPLWRAPVALRSCRIRLDDRYTGVHVAIHLRSTSI